jgi:hypothetical protein
MGRVKALYAVKSTRQGIEGNEGKFCQREVMGEGGEMGKGEGKDERGNDMRRTETGLQRGSFKQRRDGVAGRAHSYFLLFVPSFAIFASIFRFDYVIRHGVPLRASPGLAERHGVSA